MGSAKTSRIAALCSFWILVFGLSLFPLMSYSATCTGSDPCNACKNCRYCKHCAKNGGNCGVCK